MQRAARTTRWGSPAWLPFIRWGTGKREEIHGKIMASSITNRGTLLLRSGRADGPCHAVLDLFYWVGKIHLGNPLHSIRAGYTSGKSVYDGSFLKCSIKQKVAERTSLAPWLHYFKSVEDFDR